MSILLSHSSALYPWLEAAVSGNPEPAPCRISRAPKIGAGVKTAAGMVLPPGASVHVLVPGAQHRRRAEAQCHVWQGELPPHSVARLTDDVLVSTPEFLFLQVAGRAAFPQLVLFGYELCSLYTVRLQGGKYLELQRPITTQAKIASFLEGCDCAYGADKARRAIPWVLDRSRSPRESRFAMSITLPRRLGGQMVRDVALNKVVPLTPEEQRHAGVEHYEVDMAIGGTNLALEYYGKDVHEGPVRTVRDIRRESILESKGIQVHGVTKKQAESVLELERLAKLMLTAQGRRWRRPTVEQEQAMAKLLRMLYHGEC